MIEIAISQRLTLSMTEAMLVPYIDAGTLTDELQGERERERERR